MAELGLAALFLVLSVVFVIGCYLYARHRRQSNKAAVARTLSEKLPKKS